MIYCFALKLWNAVLTDGAGLVDVIHEFGWGSDPDEAAVNVLSVLGNFGLQVDEIISTTVAANQGLECYPAFMVHGYPMDDVGATQRRLH